VYEWLALFLPGVGKWVSVGEFRVNVYGAIYRGNIRGNKNALFVKIFGLINKNSGPSFHRLMMPLLLMHEIDCYITNAVEEKDFDERRPDWIYYNRRISDEVLRLQTKYHFRVAVDVDDWWHLDPHHIMFRFSKDNNTIAHAIKHLQIADVVTTTHERLAEMVYPYNKNVVIVPNAIPDHEYFPRVHLPSAKGHRRLFK